MGKFEICDDGTLMFDCPGCKMHHGVYVGDAKEPRWGFNGDYAKPTITPSIKVQGVVPLNESQHELVMAGVTLEPTPFVCHSFITDGIIQFLSDCTHSLAGQMVPLPDL